MNKNIIITIGIIVSITSSSVLAGFKSQISFNQPLTSSCKISQLFNNASKDTLIHIPKQLMIPFLVQAAQSNNNNFINSNYFSNLSNEICAQNKGCYPNYNFLNTYGYPKLIQAYNFSQTNSVYELLKHITWDGKENPRYRMFNVLLNNKFIELLIKVIPAHQVISRQVIEFNTLNDFTANTKHYDNLHSEFEKLIKSK